MSRSDLTPGAQALLAQLRAGTSVAPHDRAAADELVAAGLAAMVPGEAMLEITEAGRADRAAPPPRES